MSSPPPICDSDLSIRDASRMMAGHRAILIRTADGYGIVTDSDLRRRVLAEGWSSDRPIADAMTFPVRVVAPERPVDDVALEMVEAGVHHLPVVDDENVVGMVSDLELLDLRRPTPFAMRHRIDSARSSEELAEIGRAFPSAAVALWRSGVDAAHVGLWLSALTDRLTVRLLDSELARLGPAPVGWAWLTLGSVGRREQALTADQDHALIYANQGEIHDTYFGSLAEGVVAALAAAGFPECESRVMSSEPGWRMSLERWLARLDQWMLEPDLHHSFLSGIMFDYRQIAGPLDVTSELDQVTAKAASNPHLLKRMGRLALAHQSPLGMLDRLRQIAGASRRRVLDIKETGLFPTTEMARTLALRLGVSAPSTLERLRLVAEDPEWLEASTSLTQVFKAMQQVRFQHQARQFDAGLPQDDLVMPVELDRLNRLHLRDSFRVLRSTLDQCAYRLELDP
jgi:CBS domain-containing protein